MSDLEGFNAVLYARVSTTHHDQTTETQVREMKKWCESKGVNILAVYEEKITGTKLERPQFMTMIGRIMMGGVQILLAYDQSRLTRDEKLEDIKNMIKTTGCQVRFVTNDGDPDDLGVKVTNAVKQIFDKEEIRVLRAKTKMGMETRRLQGKHIARPAVFMFAEDVESAPEGRCILQADERHKTVTKVLPEATIYDYARQGLSWYYISTKLLGISPNVLYYEMRTKEMDPRGRGTKDRYTEFMRLYNEAKGTHKGVTS